MSTTRGRSGSVGGSQFPDAPDEPIAESEGVSSRRLRKKVVDAIQELTRAGSRWKLDRALPRLLRIIARATDSDVASIDPIDERRKALTLVGQYPESAGLPRRADEPSSENKLMVNGVLLNLRDLPVLRATAESTKGLEIATIPLYVRGRVGGALRLIRSSGRRYDDDDLHSADLSPGRSPSKSIVPDSTPKAPSANAMHRSFGSSVRSFLRRRRSGDRGVRCPDLSELMRVPDGALCSSTTPRASSSPRPPCATSARVRMPPSRFIRTTFRRWRSEHAVR